ncbi:tniQ family protein [Enterobacter sp. SGAir0187]|uniref:TniQ family protein n=1 Tax=Enterobacter sp. SGAir0187 TaxID=2836161 RepID=UPI000CEB7D75|nr:TniQ family protein [Enterobacter sp. SGAir0187]AVH17523.1 tniQ family protein [Enterobacter sp. SGAir0187]
MQLLPALPEETIFSRCVRTREVYGMTAEQFFSVFFNKKTHSVHPYLNTSLNILSEKTTETGHELWNRQTLLPLYAWAMPEYRERLEDLANTAMNLYNICNLSTYAEGHPALIKHCPVCIHHDVRNYGVGYWHRQHQIAGVTSCNHHQVRLNTIHYPRLSGITRHMLLHQVQRITLSSEENFCFAKFSSEILEFICNSNPEFISHIHSPVIRRYRKQVQSKERTSVFELALYMELSKIVEKIDHSSKNLFPTKKNTFSYWRSLLFSRSPQSPTRYLLLLYCLKKLEPS